jgi:integrase
MANLGRKGDVFVVRVRYLGKEYKKSLKVRDPKEAEAARRLVEVTIHRLLTGQVQVPAGVDPGDFIVSGGTKTKANAPRTPDLSIGQAIDEYLAAQRTYLAPSTHYLFGIHLGHWRRHLGTAVKRPVGAVTSTALETYLRGRVAAASETTAAKERRTLIHLFRWLVARQHLPSSPAADLPVLKAEGERPPFRTVAGVEAIIRRGGLAPDEELELWECIYLSPAEIARLLALAKDRAREPESYLLHALPAYTGMRRGEVIRLAWADVDLDGRLVRARSRKQSRRRAETVRSIDLHPDLVVILTDWKRQHPKGQVVVSDPATGGPLNSGQANRLFWQPLRGTEWSLDPTKNWYKIGYHTYRHSFVSNLAAAGVDQRAIDEWVGHSTDAMRRRYRHLFPATRRTAIEALRFGPADSGGRS